MATLINGNGNTPVTAQQDADLFQGIFGGSGVKMLGVGSEMAYTIEDANTITVADGECIDSEGRRIHIDVGYEDTFTIPTGTSGTTAYYIIGYYISTDSSGNETASTFVTKMSSSTATISEGSLRDGDSSKYVSLYRVKQSGLTIASVEALFSSATPLSNIADVIEETLPFSFGINGSSYGYYTTSGTFVSFRSPTGNATTARVLSGYTFSNASNDGLTGTMNNWGANSVSLSSNTATLSAGYYSSITINAASRYTAGYNAAKVGNATAARVLNGYTFTNASNVGATGTMSNRGNVTITLNCGNSYTITSGYHGGGGTVTANSLSSQTVGNITAARVLNGYVGWANGTKYTGSMNNWGSNTVNMTANTKTLSAGYYSSISINAASRYTAGVNAVGEISTATVTNTYNSTAKTLTFTATANAYYAVGSAHYGTNANYGTVSGANVIITVSSYQRSDDTISAATRIIKATSTTVTISNFANSVARGVVKLTPST